LGVGGGPGGGGGKHFFLFQKWSIPTEPRKSLETKSRVKFRPAWTSTDQCTVQDGWCVDRKQFFQLYSCPTINHSGYLFTNYAYPSTWPPTTALSTYLTTIVTNYNPLPKLTHDAYSLTWVVTLVGGGWTVWRIS
jgi:hypothetical protein